MSLLLLVLRRLRRAVMPPEATPHAYRATVIGAPRYAAVVVGAPRYAATVVTIKD